ncbi:MAG: hypothetical protein NZ959_00330 [Armatimonadetes bacterium]|nr:hypothetical protein [Armatimonadota bacterium]MDW8120760.1 hypothetical protein [Armatimonadota bacterium]
MDEQKKVLLRGVLAQLDALAEELRRMESQFSQYELTGAGPTPTSLPAINRQWNALLAWTKEILQMSLPLEPLDDSADRFALRAAVRQLSGFIRGLLGHPAPEEKPEEKKERREPLIRIREQKSPTEFTEVYVASAEEIKELIQAAVPDWIKEIIRKAKPGKKTEEPQPPPSEEPKEPPQSKTVTLSAVPTEDLEELVDKAKEELEELEDLVEDAVEELDDLKEELEEAREEGKKLSLSEVRARLREKKERMLHRIGERLRSLRESLEE